MMATNFYKGDLELEDQGKKAHEAFGFEMRTAGGTLRMRPVLKFEKEFEARGFPRLVPELQSGLQYTPTQRLKAAMGARILRILDMSNGHDREVEEQVFRVAVELVLAEYSRELVVGAVQKVMSESWQ